MPAGSALTNAHTSSTSSMPAGSALTNNQVSSRPRSSVQEEQLSPEAIQAVEEEDSQASIANKRTKRSQDATNNKKK